MNDTPPSSSGDLIRPVRLDEAPAPVPPSSGGPPAWLPVAVLALLALAAGGLFLLRQRPAPAPRVPEPAPRQEPVNPAPAQPPAPVPALEPGPAVPAAPSPADLARVEKEKLDAQKAMEEWSIVHGHLKSHGVTDWGGEAYAGALAKSRDGDGHLVARRHPAAAEAYRAAARDLAELNSVTNLVLRQWLDEAEMLAGSGDSSNALARVRAMDLLAPGDPAVAATRAAVGRLDQIGRRLRAAEAQEKAGRLPQAFVEFQEAAAIDPAHPAAAAGRTRVEALLRDQQFRQLMSAGLAALQAGKFDPAEKAFTQARELMPAAAEVRDALVQVEEGRRLARIAELSAAAAGAEKAEDWERAFRLHGEALNVDAGLAFARAGRERAQQAFERWKRAEFFLNDPGLLETERGLAEARQALAGLDGIPDGPRRRALADRLAGRVASASSVSAVTLTSDGLTDVAVYKVGQFAPFAEKTVELRPGTWTVVGSRAGHRDVRITVTVKPGDGPRTVDVRCVEKVR